MFLSAFLGRNSLQPAANNIRGMVYREMMQLVKGCYFLVAYLMVIVNIIDVPLARAELPEKYFFNIETLPLQEAILAFAVVRNLEVVFMTDIAAGIMANELKGEYTLVEALDHLFEGTGLKARFTTERAITIEKVRAQAALYFNLQTLPAKTKTLQKVTTLVDNLPEVMVVAKLISPYRLGVTASSTKTQRDFLATPQVVNVLSEQLIRDTAPRDYSEVSQFASSVDFLEASSGVFNELRLRGFAFPALKINGFASHAYIRPPDIAFIDKIELVKGPTSVLYGRMEPGGVINMMLKRPLFEPYQSIKLEISDAEYQRTVIDVSDQLMENLGGRIILFGQQEGQSSDFNQDDNAGVSLALERELDDGASLSCNYRFQTQATAQRFGTPVNEIKREIQVAELDGKFLLIDYIDSDLKTMVEFDMQNLQLMLENLDINGWGINVEFQYDKYNASSVIRYPFIKEDALLDLNDAIAEFENANDLDDEDDIEAALEALEFAAADLTLTTDDIETFDVSIGNNAVFYSSEMTALKAFKLTGIDIEQLYGVNVSHTRPEQLIWQTHDTRSTFNAEDQFLSISEGDTPINVVEDNIGIFTQWIFDIGERTTLIFGGRFDYLQIASKSADKPFTKTIEEFSSRAGVVVNLTAKSSLYANYSEAFTPQFDREEQRYFDEDTEETYEYEFISIPNPSHSNQVELGLKQNWFASDIQSSCAVYQVTKDNIVSRTLKQRNRGFECDLVGEIRADWQLILSYNHTDAVIVESNDDDPSDSIAGNEPRVTPGQVWKLWTSYQTIYQEDIVLGVGLGYKIVGDRYANDENDVLLESYSRTDASFYYLYRDSLHIDLHIKNLFNESYDDGVFNNVPFWASKGKARTFEIVAEYEF